MKVKKIVSRIAIILFSATFLLLSLVPASSGTSLAPFHLSYALNNNFSYYVDLATPPTTPGLCEISSTSPMPPTPIGECTAVNLSPPVVFQACTTNFRVNLIKVTIAAPSGTSHLSFTVAGTKGSPSCEMITLSSALGIYNVTAKFYSPNPLPCCPHEDIKGGSVGQLMVIRNIP